MLYELVMMMRKRFQLLVVAMFAATTVPVLAHHGLTAEYDITDIVELEGTVSSFNWINPHAFLTISVKDDRGATKLWRIEGGPIWYLMDAGWSTEMLQEMIQSRKTIVVTGYRARKPPAGFAGGACATDIELADGRVLKFHD
jgi:hypothetical protein